MMKRGRKSRRRALAVIVAAGVAAAGCLGVALAESAGAATSAASADPMQSTHIAPVPAAPSSPAASAAAAASTRPARQAQLAPQQLPAAAAQKWLPDANPSTRTIAGHDIGENECAKVGGADTWTQQAFSGGNGQNVAIQDTFVFASAGAAETAYQNVVTGMDTCRQTTLALQRTNKVPADAEVTQTATRPTAVAWSRAWTGVMGMSADGPQTNHIYLAVNGRRLIVLQITEFPGHAAPYDTAADPQVLTMLTDELAE